MNSIGNKKTFSSFAIIAATVFVVLVSPNARADQAAVITVNPGLVESATNFHGVQAAVDAAEASTADEVTVRIAPGKYQEHVSVNGNKSTIALVGTGKSRGDVWIGEGLTPKGAWGATEFNGKNIDVSNMTIENTAGATAGQQMAVFVGGTRIKFTNVLIKGWQDTLGIWNGAVAYFGHCEVQGSVDFVYSGGTALFDNTDVVEIRDIGGTLAAPSTPANVKYGLVFEHCHIRTAPGVAGMSLMRPWFPDGMTAYINCTMDNVSTQGWDPWDGKEKTCRAFEYGSVTSAAKPIDLTKRSSWVKILAAADLPDYAPKTVLGGWDPIAGDGAATAGSKAGI